jgi:hypothetical protein
MVSTRRGAAKRPATSSSTGAPASSNKRRKAAAAAESEADVAAPNTTAAAEPAAVTSSSPEMVGDSAPAAAPLTSSPVNKKESRIVPAKSTFDHLKGSKSGTLAVLLKIQKQTISSMQVPWGKLLSQYSQHPHVPLMGCTFTIGRSRSCNLQLKDQSISATLCKLKYSQHDGVVSVLLESTGSSGVVQVNGKQLKKNSITSLKGGDELIFSSGKNYSFIFQQCPPTMLASASSLPLVSGLGLSEKIAARALAAAAGDGASGMLSDDPAVSNVAVSVDLRKTPSVLTLPDIPGSSAEDDRGPGTANSPTVPNVSDLLMLDSNANKPGHSQPSRTCRYYGAVASGKVRPSNSVEFVVREGSNEVDMAVPVEQITEAQELPVEKGGFLPLAESTIPAILSVAGDGGGPDPPGGGASDKKETDKDLDAALAVAIAGKRQTLKEEFLRGIVEGRDTNVSFEEFPYYLSESTKSLLVTSTFIHLKRSEYAKYTAELSAISPRILITGPSGS